MAHTFKISVLFFVLFAYSRSADVIASRKLDLFNEKALRRAQVLAPLTWMLNTNFSSRVEKKWADVNLEMAKEFKADYEELRNVPWDYVESERLQRQWKLISLLGEVGLPDHEYEKYVNEILDMEKIYHATRICSFDKKTGGYYLERDVAYIFSTSRSPAELEYLWTEWRKILGHNLKRKYENLIPKLLHIAKINNVTDISDTWLAAYDIPDMKLIMKKLWMELKPLYLQFHAYVRWKLHEKYGDLVSLKGPIPAHLLGNIWAMRWENIIDLTAPYDLQTPDVTGQMFIQNFNVLRMFKIAEKFLAHMNMTKMTKEFWERSVLESEKDRDTLCHRFAQDFFDGKDYRVRGCAAVQYRDFIQAHVLLAKTAYYMYCQNQPTVFRKPANFGFFDGLAKVFGIASHNLNYLTKLKIMKSDITQSRVIINWLFYHASRVLPQLPHDLVISHWRWNILSGKVKLFQLNCEFWKLTQEIQGVEPPVDRLENDFDVVAKYHIIRNIPTSDSFIGNILQYQIFKGICVEVGQYDPVGHKGNPLVQCDIGGNVEIGNAIAATMSYGASRNWTDLLYVLTAQKYFDTSGIVDYYRPLLAWLIGENKKNKVHIGWGGGSKKCKHH